MQSLETGAQPLVSVIMSARNEERHIGAAIESILTQSYRELELLVVDDYSTDNTSSVIRSFNDKRLKSITKTHEPPGNAIARNLATAAARGDYVAYQDADDVSNETRIERQLAVALQKPDRLAVGCWIETEIAGTIKTVRLPVEHESITRGFRRTIRRRTFVAATMLWPSSIARSFPYRPMFHHMEDWDLLCRIDEAGAVEFRNVPDVLYRYILRAKGSKTQSDWADGNVFQRACQERRRRGAPEWDSIDSFREYLQRSPFNRLRWGLLRTLLAAKARHEMRAFLPDPAVHSVEDRPGDALEMPACDPAD